MNIPSSTSVGSQWTVSRPAQQEMLEAWTQWEADAPPGEGPERSRAVQIMVNCCRNTESELYFHKLGTALTSPPPLPQHIKELAFFDANLSRIPSDLPEGLEWLGFENNSNLTFDSKALPRNLRSLQIDHCISQRELKDLPPSLQILRVSNTCLNVADVRLPAGLEEFSAGSAGLTALPSLPPSLKELIVENNSLTFLPRTLPRTLRYVMLNDNRFSEVPLALFTLSQDADVLLEGNPLSESTYQQLAALNADPNYCGPRIHFNRAAPQSSSTPTRSLSDIMAVFYAEDKEKTDAIAVWTPLEKVPEASEFMTFLGRLCATVNTGNPEFKAAVRELLATLVAPEAGELRTLCFAVAQGASETCEDRIALTYMNMENARVEVEVGQGRYDNNLTALVDLGREMFRKECLEGIARDKVRTLKAVDAIETHLAYMVSLRTELALTSAIQDMRFFGVAGVTPDDLAVTEIIVKQRENTEFPRWLATTWSPWETVLKRLVPEGYAAAAPDLKVFDERLKTILQEQGLTGIKEAEIVEGAKLKHEMKAENLLPLTEKLLRDIRDSTGKNLSFLLEERWPETETTHL